MAKKIRRAVLKPDLRLRKSVELMLNQSPSGIHFIIYCRQIASGYKVTFEKVKEVASEIRNEWLCKYE